jgi:hypothetical protein
MITMGGANLDAVSPWREALGLGEWCVVFKDDLGLDHIDDLGMPPAAPRRAQLDPRSRACRWYVVWAEDVTEEDFPDTLAEMKYFDKRR